MNFTIDLKDLNKNDTSIAGGKGASLGEMTRAGIPVPPGFVVLSSTFDQFIKEADLIQEIESALDKVDHKEIHTVEGASEKIQGLIKNAVMPEGIAKEIKKQFKALGSKYVAVRSSATAEDGQDHAWAGQLDSFLNTTEKDLLQKVQHCWASLFTPRAIFYRFEKELRNQKISIAVIVQEMVVAEAAGVVFSIHPVTNDASQIYIEAVVGLGEALVSGEVTPDSYLIGKEKKEILETNINSASPILKNETVLKLTDLVLIIEQYYKFPCDIEWAVKNKKLYILQCRPITTALNKIELAFPRMVFGGKRRTNLYEARLKVLGRSRIWEKEFGAGFKTVVMNSYGELYLDFESKTKVLQILSAKTIEDGKIYVKKLYSLRDKIMKEVPPNPNKDFVNDFSNMMGYFFMIKHIFEREYESSTSEGKKLIEDWRNDDKIFEPLDVYYKFHPEVDHVGDNGWSWVYKDNKLSFYEKDLFFPKKGLENIESKKLEFKENKIIRGNPAFQGVIQGIARVILKNSDKELLREGEIIVAPMTTVDFLPIMKRAAAFITDEGGITSHAAIVARELKKPCIIGTKIATQVLKTGDMVEVDADNGIVKLIK